MRTPTDKQARETALDPTQSFIVQAPAGSGKTELLIQRFLVLLANVQKSPEEIIAITFTRKAAAEMQRRILEALEAATLPAPQEAHAKKTWMLAQAALKQDQTQHWQLLENPHRLQIQTIDSLCANLVRRMPLSSGLGSKPNTLEDPRECYLEAARQLMNKLEDEGPYSDSIARLLLHLDNQVTLLESLLMEMLGRRDQWLPYIMSHHQHSDIASFREILENGLQHITLEALAKCHATIPNFLQPDILTLLTFSAPHVSQSDFTSLPLPTLENQTIYFAIANLLLTEKGEWRKTVTIREGFPAHEKTMKARMLSLLKTLQGQDALQEHLAFLKICPPTQYAHAQWEITEALLNILPILVAELNVIFQQKNVSDFTEVTLAAIRALGELESPSDLALMLDYQIRHFLIDEFQDTSTTQARLLTHLTNGWEDNDGRTLFIVGDPMQSIYRFREAEVGLFLKAQQEGIGNISLTPLFLNTNFRSTPNIIDWVNQHFANIFPKNPDISSGAVSYSSSFSIQESTDNTGVYTHAHRHQHQQTCQIIEIIQKEQAKNPHHTIGLLVKSRTHLLDILPALKSANLPFSAVEIETLSHQRITQDLLALTSALIHLSDRAAWLAILRAPWCGLTLHDLHALSFQNHHLPLWETLQYFQEIFNLSHDGKIRLSKIIPILHTSLQQRQRVTFTTWIKYTWKALHGPQCLQNAHEHIAAEAFFSILETLESAGDILDIAQLEKKINEKFITLQPALSSTLHIMTIHKAKGLEFDTVIIPNLDKKSRPETERLLRWMERPRQGGSNDLLLAAIKEKEAKEDAIYQYLKQAETQKIQYEQTRLLYVAVTRAKKNLHLLATITDPEKRTEKNSFLALLTSAFQDSIARLGEEDFQDDEQTSTPYEKLLYRLPLDFIKAS